MNPQRFGRFNIVRKLPAGGMGRVYEAIDTANSRRAALKLIDRGTDTDSMQIVAAERLGVELHKRLCALDPRITAVYEFGETPEYLYIVMEYVDGSDLSELASAQRLGYPFIARIAQDVLEVLARAHRFRTIIDGREYQGIVHGDIKPRNIRLTDIGQTKVLDFGIAKALSMTRNFTQNMFGSIQYSSPERLNTGEVTISSDLWSVAVVLYEMVARRPYFQAETSSKLEHVIRSYREVRPIPDDCPEPLKQILSRALAPDPEARYATAEEFAADLKAFRDDTPLAVPFDAEATRRTIRSLESDESTVRTATTIETADEIDTSTIVRDTEATRRTSTPTSAPALPKPAKPNAAQRAGVRWNRVFLLVFALVSALMVFLVVNEWIVWRDSGELAHELESERLQDVNAGWERYQTLAHRANMGVSLWRVQGAMRDRLMAGTDRAINKYRTADAPGVTEAEWVQARQSAQRALELMPRDKNIRGKLRLVDAHISRIRSRRDSKLLSDSRAKFMEAADLLNKMPDPWLGLALLNVYYLHDVDQAAGALKEAERRGHEIGKRETAMLADGYRNRAERTLKEAEKAANRPERERYLELARQDFEEARQHYESIIPWGGASANLRKAYEGLDRIALLRVEQQQADREN